MLIFISYSSKEYAKAQSLREIIERNGFDCWMAPESMPPGSNYADEIPKAIHASDVFVLLLSYAAQESVFVEKELDLALKERRAIIPFHIDESDIKNAFDFRLTNIQRIEAYNKMSKAYERLIKRLSSIQEETDRQSGMDQKADDVQKRSANLLKDKTDQIGYARNEKQQDATATHEDNNKFVEESLCKRKAYVAALVAAVAVIGLIVWFAKRSTVAIPTNDGTAAYSAEEEQKEENSDISGELTQKPDEDSGKEQETVETSESLGKSDQTQEEDTTAASQENAGQTAAINTATHKWGDYSPSGTAIIETVDGTKYTAIANSLVLKTDEIAGTWADILYKGLDNPANDKNSDDSDLISFAEMETVTRNGDKLDVVNIDGETTSLELLESGEILFIGEKDTGTPMSVFEKDIQSITFDRSNTPPTEIKYCTVRLDSGSYRSPVSFLWFTVNTNEGHGMPSMHLCQELSTYSGIPLPVKRIQKLTVTKNGNDSDAYVITEDDPHPDQTEMTIKLTTGEEADITTGHYFIIYTMAKYGAIYNPSYSELREIEMD